MPCDCPLHIAPRGARDDYMSIYLVSRHCRDVMYLSINRHKITAGTSNYYIDIESVRLHEKDQFAIEIKKSSWDLILLSRNKHNLVH